jgi:hypothetical protein
MVSSRVVFPFLMALLPASAATAAVPRHLGPHVHGQATVNVAVDGDALQVDASVPGHDAVGFEHAPQGADETARVAAAKATLAAAAWLVPAAGAACSLASAHVDADGYATAAPGGHADFDASYRFRCARVDALNALDVRLAAAFPAVQAVVVNTITATGSSQVVLHARDTHVALQP